MITVRSIHFGRWGFNRPARHSSARIAPALPIDGTVAIVKEAAKSASWLSRACGVVRRFFSHRGRS